MDANSAKTGNEFVAAADIAEWLQVKGKPQTIKALLVINTLWFATMAGLSGIRSLFIPTSQILLSFGASSGAATIVDGQFWRILTSPFLHIGFLHLMMNCYVLWDVGPLVERLYGWRKFLVVYIISALGASLISLLCNPLMVSAGASGAIFGILGALLAYLFVHRRALPADFVHIHSKIVCLFIACGFICGMMAQGVDNAAHLGGLVIGAIAGFALMPRVPGDTGFRKCDLFMVVLCGGVLLSLLKLDCHLIGSDKLIIGDAVYRQAVDLLQQDKSAQALPLLTQAVSDMPDVASVRRDRARAYSKLGRQEDALQDCSVAISLDPKGSAGYIIRSGIYHVLGRDQDAVNDLTTAIKLDSKVAMAYNNRAWCYLALGDYKSAHKDIDKAIAIDNKVAIFYDTRAVGSYIVGRYAAALRDLNLALTLAPKEAGLWYHRGCLYQKLGAFDAATVNLSKALMLGYKPEAWETRLADSDGQISN